MFHAKEEFDDFTLFQTLLSELCGMALDSGGRIDYNSINSHTVFLNGAERRIYIRTWIRCLYSVDSYMTKGETTRDQIQSDSAPAACAHRR